MTQKVFISYSHPDRPIADAICSALEGHGLACWIAPRDIVPGQTWEAAIIRAIRSCKVMVLVLSSGSNSSPDVLEELRQCHKRRLAIVPFRVENVEPSDALAYYLSTRHWLDAFAGRMDQHLQALAKAVGAQLSTQAMEPSVRDLAPGSSTALIHGRVEALPEGFVNSLGNTMVHIPDGYLPQEHPQSVYVYVSQTCVSNWDYLLFVQDGGHAPRMDPRHRDWRTWIGSECPENMLNHPVVFITHEDARQFCEWLTQKERAGRRLTTGQQYLMPSLEQWRAVARGAIVTDKSVLERQWVPGMFQPTEPVTYGEASALGQRCLLGNVFEWCIDGEMRRVRRPDGRVVKEMCYAAIGGGWASSREWLGQRVREGNYGTLWCPGGWPMKDGGLRIWLQSSVAIRT